MRYEEGEEQESMGANIELIGAKRGASKAASWLKLSELGGHFN